jgi:hydroxymethylglutaryl-CoA lyase
MQAVKLIECPRDAWQGLPKIIPPETKVAYLTRLLECGFRHIDAVSFVSPKYVPQMADSEQVMELLRAALPRFPGAEIIGIVVNEQGFRRALEAGVHTIGYPYSVSERFTRQNANISVAESRKLVESMQRTLSGMAKPPQFVVYISMAFGNPYGEAWEPALVADAVRWLRSIGVLAVSLADTAGRASPEGVADLLRYVKVSKAGPSDEMEIGVHLHSRPEGAAEKVLAAYDAGCHRFDSALTGLGGCPFADDHLVGNIPTEAVLNALQSRGVNPGIQPQAFTKALDVTHDLRREYAS